MPFAKRAKKSASCIAPRLSRHADALVSLLRRKKMTVVTAESCTAGLIAAALSLADGASHVLEGAFVTYTKDQKIQALGVPKKLLRREGAVNAEVARHMAVGARRRSKAKIALSVTGVLGPLPDDDGNPVGLVYFGVSAGRKAPYVQARRFERMSHDRLRCLMVLKAFELIENAAWRKWS